MSSGFIYYSDQTTCIFLLLLTFHFQLGNLTRVLAFCSVHARGPALLQQ